MQYKHHEYQLMLSALETEWTPENARKHHLSFWQNGSNTRRTTTDSVCQVPKWNYVRKLNADQVTLEVPGVTEDNVRLYISKRELLVTGFTYKENTYIIDREYFFKMHLAENTDSKNISFTLDDGILTVLVPRFEIRVKKVVPRFVTKRHRDIDEVRLEMPGVLLEDATCTIKTGLISFSGMRYEMIHGIETAVIEYVCNIQVPETVSNVLWNLQHGILTTYIPRKDSSERRYISARKNVRESCGEIIELELPGVKETDISIEVMDGIVSVKADRFEDEGNRGMRRVTYVFAKRLFEFAHPETVERKLEEGILTLWIPDFPVS